MTWGPKPVTMEMLRESVCLPRHGIYECHGEATELSVRVVDAGLVAESNLTRGATSSHRPADADAMAAQCRIVTDAFPEEATGGATSRTGRTGNAEEPVHWHHRGPVGLSRSHRGDER